MNELFSSNKCETRIKEKLELSENERIKEKLEISENENENVKDFR